MKKIVFAALMAITLCSCSTERHLARVGHSPAGFTIGKYTPVRNYTVIQVPERTFCLAKDDASVDPIVIAITMSEEHNKPVYEGQRINGLYVMIDTYTYETKSGVMKTVPLVTPIRDYEDIQYTERMLEKSEKKYGE